MKDRLKFRFIVKSSLEGFPSFLISSLRWMDRDLVMSYFMVTPGPEYTVGFGRDDVKVFMEELERNEDQLLFVDVLDSTGDIRERYSLTWSRMEFLPFSDDLDYSSSSPALKAVRLYQAKFRSEGIPKKTSIELMPWQTPQASTEDA